MKRISDSTFSFILLILFLITVPIIAAFIVTSDNTVGETCKECSYYISVPSEDGPWCVTFKRGDLPNSISLKELADMAESAEKAEVTRISGDASNDKLVHVAFEGTSKIDAKRSDQMKDFNIKITEEYRTKNADIHISGIWTVNNKVVIIDRLDINYENFRGIIENHPVAKIKNDEVNVWYEYETGKIYGYATKGIFELTGVYVYHDAN